MIKVFVISQLLSCVLPTYAGEKCSLDMYLIRGNHPLSLVIAMRNPFHNFVSICLKNIKDFGSVFNYSSCNYTADCKDCWATLKLPLKAVNSLFSFTIWLKYQWNSNVKTQNFKDKLKWLATILGSRQLWILSQAAGAVGGRRQHLTVEFRPNRALQRHLFNQTSPTTRLIEG